MVTILALLYDLASGYHILEDTVISSTTVTSPNPTSDYNDLSKFGLLPTISLHVSTSHSYKQTVL
jgi:hypothetical protein